MNQEQMIQAFLDEDQVIGRPLYPAKVPASVEDIRAGVEDVVKSFLTWLDRLDLEIQQRPTSRRVHLPPGGFDLKILAPGCKEVSWIHIEPMRTIKPDPQLVREIVQAAIDNGTLNIPARYFEQGAGG